MKTLWKKLLAKIQPTKQEMRYQQAEARAIVKRLQGSVPKSAQVVLAGSIAKRTFLKGEADIDVFILFPQKIKKTEFESIVELVVTKTFPAAKYEIKYAEHPYLRLFLNAKRVDIVPAYKIAAASQLLSAVDRSVFHTKFINKNLKEKQIAEVLLLKKFLKANELYGAEIRVQGFSGYLCELLILHYKSFMHTLRAIAKWKMPVFIDIKNYHKTKIDKEQAIKNFHTPLVFIDPVDKTRNVAAAVSGQNTKKLIALAKRFLQKPGEKFFQAPKNLDEKIKDMKNKGNAHIVELSALPAVEDILWGQLRKLSNQLLAFLKQNEFIVEEHLLDYNHGKITMAIRFKAEKLHEKKLLKGPLLSLGKNIRDFKNAHPKARFKIKKGRIYAEVKRELLYADQAIKKFFSSTNMPSHISKTGIKIRKS